MIARQQGWGLAEGVAVLAEAAGVPILAASSLKAALDADWDDPAAREEALGVVLGCLEAVEAFVADAGPVPAATQAVAVAAQVRDQDVQTDAEGTVRLRRGVAKDRRISVEDADMRHGRKTAAP